MNTIRLEALESSVVSSDDIDPRIAVSDHHLLVKTAPTSFGTFASDAGDLPTRQAKWFRLTNSGSGNVLVSHRVPLLSKYFDSSELDVTRDSGSMTLSNPSIETPNGYSRVLKIEHTADNSAYATIPSPYGLQVGHSISCYFKVGSNTTQLQPLGIYSKYGMIDNNHPAVGLRLSRVRPELPTVPDPTAPGWGLDATLGGNLWTSSTTDWAFWKPDVADIPEPNDRWIFLEHYASTGWIFDYPSNQWLWPTRTGAGASVPNQLWFKQAGEDGEWLHSNQLEGGAHGSGDRPDVEPGDQPTNNIIIRVGDTEINTMVAFADDSFPIWHKAQIDITSGTEAKVSVHRYDSVGKTWTEIVNQPVTSVGLGRIDELLLADDYVVAFASEDPGVQYIENFEIHQASTQSEIILPGETKEYDCHKNLDEYSVDGSVTGYLRE